MKPWLALLLVVTTVVARPALADPSQAEKDHAAQLVFAGDGRRASGDHAGALESYEAADAIMRVPTTGIEVARELAALGRLIDARAKAVAVQQQSAQANEAPAFARARGEAERLIASLDDRIPTVVVKVTGADGAEVDIDGRRVTSAEPTRVDPGRHVAAARAGAVSASSAFDAREGHVAEVELKLEPLHAHRSDTAADAVAPAARPASGVPTLAWVGFGVGAAGVIAGTVTGILALSTTADLHDKCDSNKECPSDLQGHIDSAVVLSHVSTVSFAVGIAGGCLGVAALFWPRGRAGVGRSTTRVVATPSYLGIARSFQ